jgi:predicted PurR-regulated permease PerM
MSELLSLMPFINLIMVIGIVPLIKNLNNLNTTIEKLVVRLDFMENDIAAKQNRMEKDLQTINEKINKHIEQHPDQCRKMMEFYKKD